MTAASGIYQYRQAAPDLATSGQPRDDELPAIAAAGYDVVVNLALHDDPRYSLDDEAGAVRALGLEYVHIPVKFDAPTERDLAAFFDAMDALRGRRIWLHCAANLRVTAFLGLYRQLRLGWPAERAFALMHDVWAPNPVWAAFLRERLEAARTRIRIVAYDEGWPAAFAAEAAALREAFGALASRIDHVGSTAVPGLDAKPVIDIQVSVASLATLAPFAAPLARLEYHHQAVGDFDRVYPFFRKPAEWPSTHHVHLCVAGSVEEQRHLAYRDRLRADPALAARYLALKRALAAEHGGATHEERERYSLGKSVFVESVLADAGAASGNAAASRERG